MSPFRVLLAASEVVPFAKTGGLGDAVGAIATRLRARGHDVRTVLPLYRSVRDRCGAELRPTGLELDVPLQDRMVKGRVLATEDGAAYFVECDVYFDRDGLYGPPEGGDYLDNAERFIFFSRAVVELALAGQGGLAGFPTFDALHVHDWQPSLAPVYLRTLYRERPGAAALGTLLTIHNLAYQGIFWHWDMKLTGLDWSLFTPERLEFYGRLNFLKGGIIYADLLSTVSRTYAREIQTAELGCGLDGVLRVRADDLAGILNGVDYQSWRPEADPFLPAAFGPGDMAGKAVCKEALQKQLGLAVDPSVPVLGMVTRHADQKGLDILVGALDEILALDVELAILGTGDEKYRRLLMERHEQYGGAKKLGVKLAFDEPLAHLVHAGADMALMPSRFEPCGLSQLYALRYGTVPVVRSTGGLADTVVDVAARNGDPNGFAFAEYSAAALAATVARAVALFGDKRKWRKLVQTGMAQDWSWEGATKAYEALYARLVAMGPGRRF